MGDPTSNCATLRNKFELEKFRSKFVKSLPETEASPSKCSQKQKATEIDEIVKHMKHLPRFLETRKPIPDRALSFGVMDWARLEKWQYKHHNNNNGLVKSNKYSPSSSNSSSLFSTDDSSPRSTRDQSCSPAHQKIHRVTLKYHFETSSKDDFSANNEDFQSFKDLPEESKSTPTSCLNGKLKIQDGSFEKPQKIQNLSQRKLDFSRNQSSRSRSKTPDRKRPTSCSKNSDGKPRSISPLRRFSFSLSTSSQPESPNSRRSTIDGNRTHSSPLRRLFDPIFPSKTHVTDTCNEDSRTKVKPKVNFVKEVVVDDVSSSSSSRKQALFQTTVKNDRLLFTFAFENNKDILAATVTNLSPTKDDNMNLLYTFFTVHEVKKKNGNWLSHRSKNNKDQGYVPNVTAQMKVSNTNRGTREFVLYSLNPNVQLQDELGSIVVKFPRKVKSEDHQEFFNTTVILPGGSHGVPSKGAPSPLIDRWRSGGACDCGGWDLGCGLATLSNQVHTSGSRSDKVQMTVSQFELFGQGETMNKRPIFSLSHLKEGIFSVDYSSSLSPTQAFSICVSVVESRKLSQHKRLRSLANEDRPLKYTPIPGIKRSAMCKVTS
ncbi:uncharacterized protein [Rutidosis leptorrhynchoides]|uniref:uncharacterized protein n=1 Tax=Rutidosis leptorrhynchoides TaxID=125765 RepID=UPI003A99AD05